MCVSNPPTQTNRGCLFFSKVLPTVEKWNSKVWIIAWPTCEGFYVLKDWVLVPLGYLRSCGLFYRNVHRIGLKVYGKMNLISGSSNCKYLRCYIKSATFYGHRVLQPGQPDSHKSCKTFRPVMRLIICTGKSPCNDASNVQKYVKNQEQIQKKSQTDWFVPHTCI